MNKIKPFSESINAEITEVPLQKDRVKAFSDNISTGTLATEPFEEWKFPSFKFPKDFKGYPTEYKKELLERGFTKAEINAVEKLGRGKPKSGYKRYTDPNNWPEGGDAYNITKTFGFVDVISGMIDLVFPLYSENNLSEELFGDIRVTFNPLGKFTPEKRKQLEKKGFSKKDIENIEKLRKLPPAVGFTRFTNPNDWIAGGDAWNSITELGFVDIDGTGKMHPAIPAYGEDGENNIFDEAELKDLLNFEKNKWLVVKKYIQDTRDEGGPLATKGKVPKFWGKPRERSYRWYSARAIETLNVSAIDIREATQRKRFNLPLSPLQKKIIEVGWGGEPVVNYSQGEFYHRDVGWY